MSVIRALLLALLALPTLASGAPPIYKVAPNGTYPDRPAYELTEPTGPTVGKQSGRVAVGEQCDCSEPIKKGSATYCPIVGQPKKLAVCKAYPPPDPVMYSGLGANLEGAGPFAAGTFDVGILPTTELPSDSTSGAFRTVCRLVKYIYDDPVVHPGKPGVSHLHTVVGNAGFSANSTLESLMTGPSACRGGRANGSPYWVTTLLDMRTMKPVPFTNWATYYKTGQFGQGYGWTEANGTRHRSYYKDPATGEIKENVFPGLATPPNGLKLVAGNPMAMAPEAGSVMTYRWKCSVPGKDQVYSKVIPECPVGGTLWSEVFFPQCLMKDADGKFVLDSPDHKAHVAYPTKRVKNIRADGTSEAGRAAWEHKICPDSHPFPTAEVSFSISWEITDPDLTKNLRQSADSDLTLPAGIRSHGDLFIAWGIDPADPEKKRTVSEVWMENCLRKNKDCHAHLLGDGRMLQGSGP